MKVLNIELPDHLAELEKLTKVANEDLVRHWLDDLAGKYKLPRARALETSWSNSNAWHKQCETIIDDMIEQIPAAKERYGEDRAQGCTVTPGWEGIEEMKDRDQRWRAEQYVQLPLRTGIRNAKIAAFLETDRDAPHFPIPAGGRMRKAFEEQVSAVHFEMLGQVSEIGEAASDGDDAMWPEVWAALEPRSARITAQYKKLCRILGVRSGWDDVSEAAE